MGSVVVVVAAQPIGRHSTHFLHGVEHAAVEHLGQPPMARIQGMNNLVRPNRREATARKRQAGVGEVQVISWQG